MRGAGNLDELTIDAQAQELFLDHAIQCTTEPNADGRRQQHGIDELMNAQDLDALLFSDARGADIAARQGTLVSLRLRRRARPCPQARLLELSGEVEG